MHTKIQRMIFPVKNRLGGKENRQKQRENRCFCRKTIDVKKKEKSRTLLRSGFLAEWEGFEPSDGF